MKSQEIPAALTWLAHRARRVAERTEVAVPTLSHLGARERVGGFAAALFDELTVGQLEEMEDELFRFGRTIETSPALRGALADRDLPASVRQGVAHDLLAGQAQPATLRLVDYVVWPGAPATSWAPCTGWSTGPPRPAAGGWPGWWPPARWPTPSGRPCPRPWPAWPGARSSCR